MAMCRVPKPRRVAVKASCLALLALLGAAEPAAASRDDNQASQGQAATASLCSPGEIAFERVTTIPIDLLLTAHGHVSLRRVDALLLSRPELLRLERFNGWSLAGVSRNGCAIAFRAVPTAEIWTIEEVRILGPVEAVGPDYAYLRLPPPPPPRWSPTFEGYRHVMSSALDPQGATFIGLWHRTDGARSLVAMYGAEGARITRLGVANWAYDAVYPVIEIHTFGFTLVDEPDGSEPLYMTTYNWIQPSPYARRTTSRRRRRR